MSWTIEPLALHAVKVPGPEVLFQRAFGEMLDLMIYAFLLRSGSAVCLVDTGLAADHRELDHDIRRRKGPASGFVDIGEPLAQRLQNMGVEPDLVLLTSFGPYAVGGLEAFATKLPLLVSARGCADLQQPEEPALAHPPAPALHGRLRAAQRVAGERKILPGLTMLEVGVHHPASAAVLVETAAGVVGIADPVFLARNLIDGTALGAAEHAARWHTSVRGLGLRCDALLPIHDPDPRPVDRARWHPSLRADVQ